MIDFSNMAYAYGKPNTSGVFKAFVDDFKVDEVLSFDLSGAGEHQFLRIEKRGINTEELIKQLASSLCKPIKSIAYAGLKDRQALTTQWISVHCPGEALPELNSLHGSGWRVVESGRHLKKLKIGALSGNKFTLVIRDIQNQDEVDARLTQIKSGGVPNYFGPQRFGHQGKNLIKAEALLLNGLRVKDRFLRGIYYSAARSLLFNRMLSIRVAESSWNQAIPGDVMQLAGKNSIFTFDSLDETIFARIANRDLSPALPMWGKGEERMTLDALALQQEGYHGFESWCTALEEQGLERSWRAQILFVKNLMWAWEDGNLVTSFELTAGSYATSVLREVITFF